MSRTIVARAAWATLALNLAVIAWGAFVRATGSGAGCGDHWPLCNGEVVPRTAEAATLIEFAHRLTSGIALLVVVALLVAVRRAFPAGHAARRAAWASLALMLTEAAIGAGLVLFRLVADDDSMARAWSLAAHLVNTFLLLAALVLTAWWSGGAPPVALRGRGLSAPLAAGALGGVLAVGMTGAIAALGDTLFPAGSFVEGLRQELSPTAHLLLRLRVLHPTLAVAVGMVVLVAAATLALRHRDGATRRLARLVSLLVVAQAAVGFATLLLAAPVALQLTHLLVADLLWVALVLLGASALRAPAGDGAPGPVGDAMLVPTAA